MEILSHIHAHTHKDTHPEVKWVLVVDVFFSDSGILKKLATRSRLVLMCDRGTILIAQCWYKLYLFSSLSCLFAR